METKNQRKKSYYLSNEQALVNYQSIFTNVETQPTIQTELVEYGYDAEKIAEGKALLQKVQKAYNDNKREDAETISARANFDQKAEELFRIYSKHRKLAKVAFRQDPSVIKQLGITNKKSRAFAVRIEEAENFYNILKANPTFVTALTDFKITDEVIEQMQTLINEVKQARADYLREKGESQDATKIKDKAFKEMDVWLSDFFTVAHIALEDSPKLLEALTKVVYS